MSTYSEELAAATPTVTITPSPLIMEKVGQKFRGLYLGQRSFERTDQLTGEMKRNMVAHFFDGERVLFNMGAQLTRALETLATGVSVELELKELKSNAKGGKTKIYDVTPLNVPVKNLKEMFGGFLNIEAPAAEHLLPATGGTLGIEAPAAPANELEAWFNAAPAAAPAPGLGMTYAQACEVAASNGEKYGERASDKLQWVVNNAKTPPDKKLAAQIILEHRAQIAADKAITD
jgi:hypothetical protein